MTDHYGTDGAAALAAPSGAPMPAPTAHCLNHPVHDPVCFSCREFYREQIEEERRVREEVTPNAMPRHRTRQRNTDRQPRQSGTRPGIGTRTRPDSEKTSSERFRVIGDEGGRPELKKDPDASRTRPGRLRPPEYVDVSALLDGTLPEPPAPTVCPREDGIGLFYPEQLNMVFGDPESGKTLLTDYATVVELAAGGRVLRIDLDHNGPQSTVGRLLAMGAHPAALGDPGRFLYIEPEDAREIRKVCDHMAEWRPTLVILDSMGELLPMFGTNSNSADEFTTCHQSAIKPLVKAGACVVVIDHLSKGSDSRAYGAGGTMAKRRVIGGSALRVTVDCAFAPGKGGSAVLTINKDRHGGLRAHSPSTGAKEELAGKFSLWPLPDGGMRGVVKAPGEHERAPDEEAPEADVAAVAALDPPPKSAKDAETRLSMRATRARAAFKAWKSQQSMTREGDTP